MLLLPGTKYNLLFPSVPPFSPSVNLYMTASNEGERGETKWWAIHEVRQSQRWAAWFLFLDPHSWKENEAKKHNQKVVRLSGSLFCFLKRSLEEHYQQLIHCYLETEERKEDQESKVKLVGFTAHGLENEDHHLFVWRAFLEALLKINSAFILFFNLSNSCSFSR